MKEILQHFFYTPRNQFCQLLQDQKEKKQSAYMHSIVIKIEGL